jgi:hypothetical protein
MPAEPVTISATLTKEATYAITTQVIGATGNAPNPYLQAYNGNLFYNEQTHEYEGLEGQEVVIQFTLGLYNLISITVNGGMIECKQVYYWNSQDSLYSFIMPAAVVSIEIVLEKIATTDYWSAPILQSKSIITVDEVLNKIFVGQQGWTQEYEFSIDGDDYVVLMDQGQYGLYKVVLSKIDNSLVLKQYLSYDGGATWEDYEVSQIYNWSNEENGYVHEEYCEIGLCLTEIGQNGFGDFIIVYVESNYTNSILSGIYGFGYVNASGEFVADVNQLTIAWQDGQMMTITGTVENDVITIDFTSLDNRWPFGNLENKTLGFAAR